MKQPITLMLGLAILLDGAALLADAGAQKDMKAGTGKSTTRKPRSTKASKAIHNQE